MATTEEQVAPPVAADDGPPDAETPAEMAARVLGAKPIDPNSELDKLEALSQKEPEGWRPEPGDTISGTILMLGEAGQDSEFGSYPLLTIERRDGDVVNVHGFHAVLKREIERQSPRVGDLVAITYHGLKDGGNFGHFENYRMLVRRPF